MWCVVTNKMILYNIKPHHRPITSEATMSLDVSGKQLITWLMIRIWKKILRHICPPPLTKLLHRVKILKLNDVLVASLALLLLLMYVTWLLKFTSISGLENIAIFSKFSKISNIFHIYRAFAHILLKYKIYCVSVCFTY